MRSSSKLLRRAKWAGVIFSALIFIDWVFSVPLFGDTRLGLHTTFSTGCLSLDQGLLIWIRFARPYQVTHRTDVDMSLVSIGLSPNSVLIRDSMRFYWRVREPNGDTEYTVPLWLPFLLVAAPTACLWYRDRRNRFQLGHCRRCNYNLTGNTTGICPECGTSLANLEGKA